MELKSELFDKYINTFQAKDDNKYGVRKPKPQDIISIIDIFKNIYGYYYLYPWVYEVELLKKQLNKKNHLWLIGVSINTEEIISTAVIKKKNQYTITVGKGVIKKEYQGIGIASGLAAESLKIALKNPQFKNSIKLDMDVRANNISVQRWAEKVNCHPYGFIPSYNNYADKRDFDSSKGDPFIQGHLESVMLYVIPFYNLWKKRQNHIVLLDNEDMVFFYENVKKYNRKMKKDYLILQRDNGIKIEDYTITEDIYKGVVMINGYLHEKSLKNLLEIYSKWNVIEWRIPATINGLNSQQIGLDRGFKVVGYNLGSNYYDKLFEDSILLCYFPNGVDFSQFDRLNLLENNKPLINRVINSLNSQ